MSEQTKCERCGKLVSPFEFHSSVACWEYQNAALRAKLAEAEAIIGKLLRTADDVPIAPGMTLYAVWDNQPGTVAFVEELAAIDGWSRGGDGALWVQAGDGSSTSHRIEDCYSTEAAALAAAEKGDKT